jgi:hypothetical protein
VTLLFSWIRGLVDSPDFQSALPLRLDSESLGSTMLKRRKMAALYGFPSHGRVPLQLRNLSKPRAIIGSPSFLSTRQWVSPPLPAFSLFHCRVSSGPWKAGRATSTYQGSSCSNGSVYEVSTRPSLFFSSTPHSLLSLSLSSRPSSSLSSKITKYIRHVFHSAGAPLGSRSSEFGSSHDQWPQHLNPRTRRRYSGWILRNA